MKIPGPKPPLRELDTNFIDAVYAALANGGFSVAEQIRKPLVFTWNSDAPPLIATGLKQRPLSVLVLAAVNHAQPSVTRSGGVCSWEWRDGNIVITEIDPLDPSTDYTLTVLVLL